ncbi:MAG: 2-amino-4-hydroxy-6-hydroxymethyldihydropteridine diphosphokinase [Deltaproteobacteria bacterium]|nr:2-amino-4-hydroxy-6-hydroxymethyldihydropteridine diphosphokinase [Deltaproteobacteria bacterium]
MTQAFVAVGSNIDPEKHLLEALCLLARSHRVTGVSTVYRTEPEGRPHDPPYLNCVVRLDTDMEPESFKLKVLRRIEDDLGRERTSDRSENRTIDLDLIIFGSMTVNSATLTIPDPDISNRPYLALPLYELANALVLPGSGKKIADIAVSLRSCSMEPMSDYTELVRSEVLKDAT